MTVTWDELEHMTPKEEWRLPVPPTCAKCSYNLTGLEKQPEQRCPECGATYRWPEVRKRAAHTWALTLRLRHANDDSRTGLIIGLSGWFLLGFSHLMGGMLWLGLGHILAFLASVMAIVLGSQVLNIRRVPRWARSHLNDPPLNIWLGIGAIFSGLTLLAGSLIIW